MNVELGDKVVDQITEFNGVVTGIVYYITGCHQALVAPKSTDNVFKESHWFDLDRLYVNEKSTFRPAQVSSSERPGADKPAPVR